MIERTEARFTSRKVHIFKEQHGPYGRSYCGLGEWDEIWQPANDGEVCISCVRFLARRVEELEEKLDA